MLRLLQTAAFAASLVLARSPRPVLPHDHFNNLDWFLNPLAAFPPLRPSASSTTLAASLPSRSSPGSCINSTFTSASTQLPSSVLPAMLASTPSSVSIAAPSSASILVPSSASIFTPSSIPVSSPALISTRSPSTKLSSASAPSATSSSKCHMPTGPLTNEQQVGASIFGTLCQQPFPQWLGRPDGTPFDSAPWGDKTPQNSDSTVHTDIPVTGIVRHYEWTISRGSIWADGVRREVMLVNDQYPGPSLEANWGDEVEVIVHNNISDPAEGTSLHWHGLRQLGNNWMDGVPSVSQCPIAPGSTFTYRFTAQLYGTSWYHAHYSAQYTAGVAGPIIIHGPSQLPYDIDVGPVMLTDWYHIPYFSIVQDAVGTDMSKIPVVSDSLLINGRGRFNCTAPSYSSAADWLGSNIADNQTWQCVDGAPLSQFRFQSGKTHRLRLVNHGADGVQKFSIDGHTMTVIATDFVPTVPYTTNVVTLGVAQRTDVLVTANGDPQAAYWMRARTPGGIGCGGASHPEVLAAIYYQDADPTIDPTTSSSVTDTDCRNQALAVTQPEFAITPSENPYHQDLTLALVRNSTGSFEWQINKQTFRANFNSPLLYAAAAGNTSYPYDPQWNVYNYAENKSIVMNITNETPLTHPFHLHGHNFYVLNIGSRGTAWDGSTVNPSNPMRRDTQIIPSFGWVAIAFEADNPGVWPFHCHVAWHLSGGLAMNVMTRPAEIPAIPAGMQDATCAAWDAYSSRNVVDQIDSGS